MYYAPPLLVLSPTNRMPTLSAMSPYSPSSSASTMSLS